MFSNISKNVLRFWRLTCLKSVSALLVMTPGKHPLKVKTCPRCCAPHHLLLCLLHQVGHQDGCLHKANGGMVLLTFFMCRIALFPFMYWMYGRHYGIPLHMVPFHLPLLANLGNSCILAPQVYWFVLLCRKGYRLYQRSRGPRSPSVADRSKDDWWPLCSCHPKLHIQLLNQRALGIFP